MSINQALITYKLKNESIKFYLLVGLTVMDNSWFKTRMVLDAVVCAGCLKPKMVKSHVLLNRKNVLSILSKKKLCISFHSFHALYVTHLSADDQQERSWSWPWSWVPWHGPAVWSATPMDPWSPSWSSPVAIHNTSRLHIKWTDFL